MVIGQSELEPAGVSESRYWECCLSVTRASKDRTDVIHEYKQFHRETMTHLGNNQSRTTYMLQKAHVLEAF